MPRQRSLAEKVSADSWRLDTSKNPCASSALMIAAVLSTEGSAHPVIRLLHVSLEVPADGGPGVGEKALLAEPVDAAASPRQGRP